MIALVAICRAGLGVLPMLTGWAFVPFLAALFAWQCNVNMKRERKIDTHTTEIRRLRNVVRMVCDERSAAEAREAKAAELCRSWYEIARHEQATRHRRRGCPRLRAYEQETD
jgi:hypothetical protein